MRWQLDGLLPSAERVARLGHVQLGDSPDLARLELADGLLLLAVEQQQLADALVLVAGRVPDVGLRLERARQHAQVGQASHERVGRGLEHADQQRPGLVGRQLDRGPRLVGGLRRRLVGGGGEVADDGVEQAAELDALGRRADQHRGEDAVLHPLAQAQLELVVLDVLALEVLGHDVVIGLGRGLEQLVPAPRDLVGELVGDGDLDLVVAVPAVRLSMDEVHVAAEPFGCPDGQLDGRDLVAEGGPQRVEGRRRVGVLPVALVDEEARGGVRGPGVGDRLLEPGLHPGRGVHDEDRAIGRGEALDDVGHEVRVAGRVDERDPRPVVLERADREAQRLLALLLLGLEVEVGGAIVHASESRDGPGLEHELFRERRLAGTGMPGQDDAPKVRKVNALHRHGSVGPHSCLRRRVGRSGCPTSDACEIVARWSASAVVAS